jgi:hypothetical protein
MKWGSTARRIGAGRRRPGLEFGLREFGGGDVSFPGQGGDVNLPGEGPHVVGIDRKANRRRPPTAWP